jgi:hypothetical protein
VRPVARLTIRPQRELMASVTARRGARGGELRA